MASGVVGDIVAHQFDAGRPLAGHPGQPPRDQPGRRVIAPHPARHRGVWRRQQGARHPGRPAWALLHLPGDRCAGGPGCPGAAAAIGRRARGDGLPAAEPCGWDYEELTACLNKGSRTPCRSSETASRRSAWSSVTWTAPLNATGNSSASDRGISTPTAGRWSAQMTYRGQPADYAMRIALAWIGPLRIELIEMAGGDSVYADFVREHGYGVHHFGVLVDDMDAALAQAAAAGLTMTHGWGRLRAGWRRPLRLSGHRKGSRHHPGAHRTSKGPRPSGTRLPTGRGITLNIHITFDSRCVRAFGRICQRTRPGGVHAGGRS